LNALRDFVDQVILLLVVFVEQEMQLIKVGPAICQWCFLYRSRSVIVSARS